MKTAAIINPDTPEDIIISLKKNDFEPVEIEKTPLVAGYLAGHPDIQVFPHNKTIFCHPDISLKFLRKIERLTEIKICKTKLSPVYPGDIPYNIASIPGFAFHKLKCTEPGIKLHLENNSIKLVDVNQGYTKCSCIPMGNSIITADESIHKKCNEYNINSLKISPGYVSLTGCRYGFLGGASGIFDNRLYLTGNLKNHPDKINIENFTESLNYKIFYLSENDPLDSGSIFFI
jgi:hypothetical protein